MQPQSYIRIKNALAYFATHHLTLKRFNCSFSEQLDNFSSSDNSFPILYCVPNDVSFLENTDSYSFRIYCLDLLQKDRSNESFVLNNTLLVLRDLVNWIRLDRENEINISNTPVARPVNNFLVDFSCGWYLDLEIEGVALASDCAIPFSNNFNPDSNYILSEDGFIICAENGDMIEWT